MTTAGEPSAPLDLAREPDFQIGGLWVSLVLWAAPGKFLSDADIAAAGVHEEAYILLNYTVGV